MPAAVNVWLIFVLMILSVSVSYTVPVKRSTGMCNVCLGGVYANCKCKPYV